MRGGRGIKRDYHGLPPNASRQVEVIVQSVSLTPEPWKRKPDPGTVTPGPNRVSFPKGSTPCVTHHFPAGSLHAPYGRRSLLAVGRVMIKAEYSLVMCLELMFRTHLSYSCRCRIDSEMGSCRKHQFLDRFPDTTRLVDAKQSVELGTKVPRLPSRFEKRGQALTLQSPFPLQSGETRVPAPEGLRENSPAIYRWGRG